MDGEGGGGARKGREEGLERGGRGVGEGEGTKRGSIPVRANIKPKLLQGVLEKLCFFTIHCNPSLAYFAVRDLHSSQRNASVQ